MLLHFSVRVSMLERRITALVQELGLMSVTEPDEVPEPPPAQEPDEEPERRPDHGPVGAQGPARTGGSRTSPPRFGEERSAVSERAKSALEIALPRLDRPPFPEEARQRPGRVAHRAELLGQPAAGRGGGEDGQLGGREGGRGEDDQRRRPEPDDRRERFRSM